MRTDITEPGFIQRIICPECKNTLGDLLAHGELKLLGYHGEYHVVFREIKIICKCSFNFKLDARDFNVGSRKIAFFDLSDNQRSHLLNELSEKQRAMCKFILESDGFIDREEIKTSLSINDEIFDRNYNIIIKEIENITGRSFDVDFLNE